MSLPTLKITIGSDSFEGRLATASAPYSCSKLKALLPYRGHLIQARWSGESLWSPMGSAWSHPEHLREEDPTEHPSPGEILLYAGAKSEPELLVPYGTTRFACRAGALAGNRVITIGHDLARLAELGREALWHGALPFSIELD